jgi:hypothetical protein
LGGFVVKLPLNTGARRFWYWDGSGACTICRTIVALSTTLSELNEHDVHNQQNFRMFVTVSFGHASFSLNTKNNHRFRLLSGLVCIDSLEKRKYLSEDSSKLIKEIYTFI